MPSPHPRPKGGIHIRFEIPYGQESVEIDFDLPYTVLVPNEVKVQDEARILADALANPISAPTFSDFAGKAERLLVIINDATRPTPTRKVLDLLQNDLLAHPDVTYIVATGVHRAPTDEEYEFIFGGMYEKCRDKIVSHDARKQEDMVYLGKSTNGTEMYLNKLVPEIGNVLVIGSVEPHYFAGYTGGRKAFLPGVASYKTIEMNHKAALSDSARSLALEGNPVHEDMIDAMNVLDNINVFSIQTVLTGDHSIYAVTAGDLHKSFDAAIEKANEVFCVPLDAKADIVISAAPYPMDIDLYQSQKALDNSKLALKDGGVTILVSKCRMGVGEEAFLDLLGSAATPQEIMKKLEGEYKLGYHKAAKMAQIGTWASIYGVSDLPPETLQKAHLKPFGSVQEALDAAIEEMRGKGREPTLVIMPAGSLTIPLIRGD